jgi:FAD:protein FMN transferase
MVRRPHPLPTARAAFVLAAWATALPAASLGAGSTTLNLEAQRLGGGTATLAELVQPASVGPTLLVFATVWCRICISELPELRQWKAKHPGSRLLYVMSGTPAKRTQAHCDKYGIDSAFEVLVDHQGPIADAFRVQATPSLFLFEGPDSQRGPYHRVSELPEPAAPPDAEEAKATEPTATFIDEGRELGTSYSVSVSAARDRAEQVERDLAEVRAMTRVLEARLSEWKDDSEISKLNRAAAGRPVPLSKTLWNILQGALQVSRATEGAFDVTWRPLGAVWKEAEQSGELPTDAALQGALAHVGYRYVLLEGESVRFARPGVELGIAGVAKGWIIDAIFLELSDRGYSRILVNIGGDLRMKGPEALHMKLADPFAPDRMAAKVTVRDRAMATSGNYFRTRTVGGKRVGHILDPRTGRPPDFEGSVTVITRDAAMADALATALFVMGPDAGLAFATRTPTVDVVYATRDGLQATIPEALTPGSMALRADPTTSK